LIGILESDTNVFLGWRGCFFLCFHGYKMYPY
jgi:hypothetical protein